MHAKNKRKLENKSFGKKIIVDLDRQILYAVEGKKIVLKLDCASGDKDNPTPLGSFKIYRKHKKYVSKTYNVHMDNAMFFYKGYAIHQAHVVGVTSLLKSWGVDYFGSHGCVRLSESDVSKLFEWTPMTTKVEIKKVYTP